MFKANIDKITVGICAKNEAKNIKECLSSVLNSLRIIEIKNKVVVINVNNSTDETMDLAESFMKNQKLNNFFVVSSGSNLVEAQRFVVEKFPADIYVFIDADTNVDKLCISELVNALQREPKLIAAYAKYLPCHNKYTSWWHYVSVIYDTQSQLQTERFYLHGRVFATREWYIPTKQEVFLRIQKSDSLFLKKLPERSQAFISDDIYLSSYILDKHGIGSIRQIPSAVASYESTHSMKDMSRVYRRRNIEMKKMLELYPEFNYLLPYLNRRTNWWNFFFNSRFLPRLAWLFFIIQKKLFRCMLAFEMAMITRGIATKEFVQWIPATTSKIKIRH
jgi:glycosyltransferase involved in cell wall biosynthesis